MVDLRMKQWLTAMVSIALSACVIPDYRPSGQFEDGDFFRFHRAQRVCDPRQRLGLCVRSIDRLVSIALSACVIPDRLEPL